MRTQRIVKQALLRWQHSAARAWCPGEFELTEESA